MNAIYMTNTNETNVLANNVIPCYINKKAGGQCVFFALNNSILILKPGYYEINATVTVTAPAAGNVTITAQKNGENITGITATETITTADTEYRTLYLHGFVRVLCHESDSIAITLLNDSDIAIDVTNVSFSIIG